MSQAPIPAGYHDADSAAKLLGITKRELLKTLRELAWVHVGGDQHNLPRHELKAAGWMTTHDRAYCLKGKSEIVKSYSTLLLSQIGFQELKKAMEHLKHNTAVVRQAPVQPVKAPVIKIEPAAEKPYDKAAADIERNKHLAQMAEWGLPIAAGRN
jgi:hypothetical protein